MYPVRAPDEITGDLGVGHRVKVNGWHLIILSAEVESEQANAADGGGGQSYGWMGRVPVPSTT